MSFQFSSVYHVTIVVYLGPLIQAASLPPSIHPWLACGRASSNGDKWECGHNQRITAASCLVQPQQAEVEAEAAAAGQEESQSSLIQ
jgi:hypothetical protein